MYYTVTIFRISISCYTVYNYRTLALAINLYINRIQLLKRICAVTSKLRVPASPLVASVGNRDQWKNNRSAVLNGNAIESALLKLRDRAYE
jgi:hypothetical protein